MCNVDRNEKQEPSVMPNCKQLNAGISVAIYWGGINVQARRDGAEGVSSEYQHPSNRETGTAR